MMSTLKIVLFIALLVYTATGCSDREIVAGCPPKKEIAPEKADLLEISLFMDASGSMRAFMPANVSATDFQVLVPDLLQRLGTDLPKAAFYTLAERGAPINSMNIRDAREGIAYGRFAFGSSSVLPDMIDSIVAYTGKGKAAVLITDGIYSPATSKTRMRDQVVTDIRSALAKAAQKDYMISCFQLSSQFNGKESPYYLFVCSSPQNGWLIREKLRNSLSAVDNSLQLKVYHEIHFGAPALTPFYSIIPYVDNTGAGEPSICPDWDNRFLSLEKVDIREKPACWIGIDLSALPAFALQGDYLKKNLVVEGKGMEVSITGPVIAKPEFLARVTDAVDNKLSQKCTHFIRLKIERLNEKIGELHLSLKNTEPDWVSQCSHIREDSVETKRDKTYGLSYIFDGIRDAYSSRSNAYFFNDLQILVAKK